ncbi:MAG TPA: hypothetical protein VLG28_00850 [Acidimicrobiia bacterium]|jgi:hypothetical protein|nr:hypothetical protein [Acidimicrobiia bacterium]
MEARIVEIATVAGRVLLHPVVIAVALLAVLALATGLAGRLAVFIEDLGHPIPAELTELAARTNDQ